MEEQKIINLLQFYLLATKLKDLIRSGWKIWHVKKERLESVAEHVYGTCILAIAINSEFDLDIDIDKVVMMLNLHELEEVVIGDITPFDNVTKSEKRKLGKIAVEDVLKSLNKKHEYIGLIDEFESGVTKEAMFAKMCDKLEANIQCKLYCEEKNLDINDKDIIELLKDSRIEKLINSGEKTISDLFIENDRHIYKEKVFEDIADYIKKNELLKLK